MTEKQYQKFKDVCAKTVENLPTLKKFDFIVFSDMKGVRVVMRTRGKKTLNNIVHCFLYHLKKLEAQGKQLYFDDEIKITVVNKKASGKKPNNRGNRQNNGRRSFQNRQNTQQHAGKKYVIKKRTEGSKC